MSKTKKVKKPNLFLSLINQIRQDKKTFWFYLVLQSAIVGVAVRNIFTARWENVFTCLLAELLLFIPPLVERSFKLKLPATLEILAYVFVFCAEILGEIGNFYQRFAFWDVMLHTVNGFMFAAFGFCLVDIFNKNRKFRFELSPFFLAMTAFCFSMTIGVLWEFFEYLADAVLHTDMQKDSLRTALHSVWVPNDLGQKVTHVNGITKTVIYTAGGEIVELNGYLDLGLTDTIKDLFVNFVGAIIFSVIGFFYVKHRGRGHIAGQFIPVYHEAEKADHGQHEQQALLPPDAGIAADGEQERTTEQ